MAELVVDSNVLVASFLKEEAFHQEAQSYIAGLEAGEHVFHLPMLVVVEVAGAMSRRLQTNRFALMARARKSLTDWESGGKMRLYELNRPRMQSAILVAEQYHLKGPDAVIAALAEELDVSLKTFDKEILDRFSRAST